MPRKKAKVIAPTASGISPDIATRLEAAAASTSAHTLGNPELIKIGRFILLEQIGAGAMGEIYAAYDEKLDRKVALKLVRMDGAKANRADKRLLREAHALARVSHPNVVPVYDAGTANGRVYIAMELVRGVTLSQWIDELCDMPERERQDAILTKLLAAGRGLVAAHEAGVVHRDFKPDNILVGDDGRVRVVDFGLARAFVDEDKQVEQHDVRVIATPDRHDATQHSKDQNRISHDRDEATGVTRVMDSDEMATDRPRVADKRDEATGVTRVMDSDEMATDHGGSEHTPEPPADPAAPRTASPAAAPGHALPKAALRLTRTGAVVGTPRFMAPEQMHGQAVDERSDQFSFCVTAYHALCGDFPYPGSSFAELMESISSGTIQVSRRFVDVPLRSRKVILRGLSVEPSERFASMRELLSELEPEPSRRPVIAIMAAGLAAMIIVIIAMYMGMGGTREDPCAAQRRALDALWNQERKAEVTAALLRSGLPYAESTTQSVQAALDSYAQEIGAHTVAACEDTSMSPQAHDKRMMCVDRGKRQFAALVAALAEPRPDNVERALNAATSLPDLDGCNDAENLIYGVEPPVPALASRVAKIRDELARADALQKLGSYQGSLAVARPALADAEALDYPPVRAEAIYQVAHALGGRSTKDALTRSEALYFDALDIAQAERHDQLAAAIWRSLTKQAASRHSSMEDARAWWRRYQAAVKRIGDHARDRAELHHIMGMIHERDGEYNQAAEEQRRAIDFMEKSGRELSQGRYYNDLANALINLPGESDNAIAYFEKSLAVSNAKLGPAHPRSMAQAFNYGLGLLKLRRLDRAREIVTTTLDTWTARYGEVDQRVARIHMLLTEIEAMAGRLDEAAKHADASLRIYRQTGEPGHITYAELLADKGRIASSQGKYQEALAAYTEALDIRQRHLDKNHPTIGLIEGSLVEQLFELGRYDEAMNHLENAERIIENDPNASVALRGWVLLLRGHLLFGKRQFHAAVKALEKAITLLDDWRAAAQNRALARWMLARALRAAGNGNTERIRELATSARQMFAAQGEAGAPDAQEISHWLETLPQPGDG